MGHESTTLRSSVRRLPNRASLAPPSLHSEHGGLCVASDGPFLNSQATGSAQPGCAGNEPDSNPGFLPFGPGHDKLEGSLHTTAGSSAPRAHSRCPPGSSESCKPGPQSVPRVIQDSTPFHAPDAPLPRGLKQTSSSSSHPQTPPETFPSCPTWKESYPPPPRPLRNLSPGGSNPTGLQGCQAHQQLDSGNPTYFSLPIPACEHGLPSLPLLFSHTASRLEHSQARTGLFS